MWQPTSPHSTPPSGPDGEDPERPDEERDDAPPALTPSPESPRLEIPLFVGKRFRLSVHLGLPVALALLSLEYRASPFGGALFAGLFLLALALREGARLVAAKALGREVTKLALYPFGSLLETRGGDNRRTPSQGSGREEASHHLAWLALVGPATNLLLALTVAWFRLGRTPLSPADPALQFVAANGWLALLNLVPVEPLDGGLLLRPLPERAALLLARIGQALLALLAMAAIAVGEATIALSLLGTLLLSMRTLLRQTTLQKALGLTVGEMMRGAADVDALQHGMRVRDALSLAARSPQEIFPLLHNRAVLGVIERARLLRAAAEGESGEYLTKFVERAFESAAPDEALPTTLARTGIDAETVIVVESGFFVGMLFVPQLLEVLLVRDSEEERAPALSPWAP